MSIKIMHTADWHVGMEFSGYGSFAGRLKAARVEAIDRLVDIAERENCDLFVVAGDMFDRVSVSARLVEDVMRRLGEFSGSAVLLLPGNHDYSEEKSGLWERIARQLPGHGVILDRKEKLSLERFGLPGVAVYPAPCARRHSPENATDWIKNERPREDEIGIGIAHGSLAGISPDFSGSYYPMRELELKTTECVDLWLLGHTHAPYPDEKRAIGREVFYPGTPEPDGLDCTHRGGAWVIEVDEDRTIRAVLHDSGQFAFADERVEVTDGSDLAALMEEYADREDLILRLAVHGWITRDDYLYYIGTGENRLREHLLDSVAYLVDLNLDDLFPEIDEKVIDDEFTEGSFPHRLLTRVAEEGDDEALQMAYRLIKEVQHR